MISNTRPAKCMKSYGESTHHSSKEPDKHAYIYDNTPYAGSYDLPLYADPQRPPYWKSSPCMAKYPMISTHADNPVSE